MEFPEFEQPEERDNLYEPVIEIDYVCKPHFILAIIERFTHITRRHIAFILLKTNLELRELIEYLDDKDEPLEKLVANDEFPELTYKEEIQLMDDFRAGKDSKDKKLKRKRDEALKRLIDTHMPIFIKIAELLNSTGEYVDDLVQEALIRFAKSLDQKDYKRKSRVIIYTLRMVYYAMERYLYQNKQPIHFTANGAEMLEKLQRIHESSKEDLTSADLLELIYKDLELEGTKLGALEWLLLHDHHDDETKPDSLPNAGNPLDFEIERAQLCKRLDEVLGRLIPNQEAVIRLRTGYFPDCYVPDGLASSAKHTDKRLNDKLTFEEIAKMLGFTRARMQQIERKALEKLQKPYMRNDLREFWPERKTKEQEKVKVWLKPAKSKKTKRKIKRTKKCEVKSRLKKIKFVRLIEECIVVLNINGKEVEAVSLNRYAAYLGLNPGMLPYYLKKANLKPIKGVTFAYYTKACALYIKKEVDAVLPKIVKEDGTVEIEIDGELVVVVDPYKYFKNLGISPAVFLLKYGMHLNPIESDRIKKDKNLKQVYFRKDEMDKLIEQVK